MGKYDPGEQTFPTIVEPNDAVIGRSAIGNWPFLGNDSYVHIYPRYTRELVKLLQGSQADVAAAVNAAAEAKAALPGRGAELLSSASTTVNTGAGWVTIALGGVEFSDDGYQNASYPNEIVIPAGAGGRYAIAAGGQYTTGTTTGNMELGVMVNNTLKIHERRASTGWGALTLAPRPLVLAAGARIKLVAQQSTGSNLPFGSAWLSVNRMA